jgi:hypothetical protein
VRPNFCDDDLYMQSIPLWHNVTEAISRADDGSESADYLLVTEGLGYARFCAEWLWRVLGESGHVAVSSAVHGRAAVEPQTVELAGVDLAPGSVDRLRRLAVGNWMRRWWPASERDGIAGLDRALLDAEIALLTAAAQDFFTEDTLDSDVAQLLAPHAGTLLTLFPGPGFANRRARASLCRARRRGRSRGTRMVRTVCSAGGFGGGPSRRPDCPDGRKP